MLDQSAQTVFRESFRIRFEGPALIENKISARELATTLIAIEELFSEADRVFNGSKTDSVSLQIVSRFDPGSFEAFLELVQRVPENITPLIESEQFKTAGQIWPWILGPGGVIWLIRKLRNRKPKKVEVAGTNATLVVDSENVTVENNVYELHQHFQTRKNITQAFEPLTKPGIEEIKIEREDGIGIEVDDSDAEFFSEDSLKVLSGPEAISVNDSTLYVRIVQAAFESKYVWRFDSGGERFTARVVDEEFLGRIDDGERFAKGDVLFVKMRITQKLEGDNLVVERTIVEVLQHLEQSQFQQSEFEF